MKIGIWLVREEAEMLGGFLAKHLPGEISRPWRKTEQSGKAQFEQAFNEFNHWVLVMATGIAVRYLEGLPQNKKTDPAVVVLDEGARYAVSLLSGHEGGANLLAYRVANLTGALPVITTASETCRPLIVGIGCRKGIDADQIQKAVSQALQQINRPLEDVREIATIDLKGEEPGLLEWCTRHHFALHTIKQELLAKRPWVSKTSAWVQKNIGVEGVCEPAALLASVRGELILEKMALNGVTVAIVEDPVWKE
ncbi:MAG: cobalamin biosynthesis protein [SAR324 cluster bacterium]|nr:cobalamin biosynthesis protein [SAR324 cluster bacterium]